MAMLLCGVLALAWTPSAAPAANPSTPTSTDLHDPQLDSGGQFPPLGGFVVSDDVPPPGTQLPLIDSTLALRQRELVDSPMAPLPPAIVAGPIGIALAGWMARRANRRGGRV